MTYACIHSQHADYEYTLLNINMYYKRTLVIIVSKPAMIATAHHGYFAADTDTSRSAHVTEPVAAPVRQNCLQALAGENTSPQIWEKSGGRIAGVRQHALITGVVISRLLGPGMHRNTG